MAFEITKLTFSNFHMISIEMLNNLCFPLSNKITFFARKLFFILFYNFFLFLFLRFDHIVHYRISEIIFNIPDVQIFCNIQELFHLVLADLGFSTVDKPQERLEFLIVDIAEKQDLMAALRTGDQNVPEELASQAENSTVSRDGSVITNQGNVRIFAPT